jgi:hypothetical protein
MRFTPRFAVVECCDERRPRRHGYRLRCLEPAGHDGPHRWTLELVDGPPTRDTTRPAAGRHAGVSVSSVARRVGRILDGVPMLRS